MFRLVVAFFGLAAFLAGAEQHWDIQYRYRDIDSTLTINDLVFPDAKRGIACGYTTDRKEKDHPLVLLTSDGGEHWTDSAVRETGISLFFLDDSNGWMITDKGVWVTSESGHSWTKLKNAPSGLVRLWFLDKDHGFAGGLQKRVFETKDGGETWTLLPILKDVESNPVYTTFGEVSFTEDRGIISGWYVPPVRGGPAWMEPDSGRKQVPHYAVMLETKDGGKTWTKSDGSIFGQVVRISMAPQGTGLGLIRFNDQFDYPSEVYKVNLHTGKSEHAFREKNRSITDVRLFAGSNKAVIAGYEVNGPVFHSPIPGKLKVLSSDDLEHWKEMTVDYRAVAHSAIIAGPDENHLWIATDTGMILKLVSE